MNVHIYAPQCVEKRAIACTCPDCGKRTRILTYTYEWFGPDGTCILCGRSFNEDGWVPLPFVRGSRTKEITKAKERFRHTKAMGRDEFLPRLEAERGA
jgi:hypothetical protein